MTSFWLEFEYGGQVQQAHFEKSSISIGRDRASDFVLDHPTVSRQHALIVHRGGGVFQLVVLSRGGLTALEQQPVQSSEVNLYDGARITLGQHTLRFRCPQAIGAPGGGPAAVASAAPSPMQGAWDGQLATPSEPAPSPGPVEDAKSDAGIVSWDEIAASSEAQEEEEASSLSDFERIRRAKAKSDEQTNPVLVGGAGIIIVGMLVFLLFGGGSKKGGSEQNQVNFQDMAPLEVNVRCLDQGSCRRDALRSYALAVETFESRDVEVGNLYESYRHLMEAKAYLDAGGIAEAPVEMKDWQTLHDRTRGELNELFDRFRMQHHQASSRKRYNEMAEVIGLVMAYFPDRTSREYRWARDEETNMRARGVFPSRNRGF